MELGDTVANLIKKIYSKTKGFPELPQIDEPNRITLTSLCRCWLQTTTPISPAIVQPWVQLCDSDVSITPAIRIDTAGKALMFHCIFNVN